MRVALRPEAGQPLAHPVLHRLRSLDEAVTLPLVVGLGPVHHDRLAVGALPAERLGERALEPVVGEHLVEAGDEERHLHLGEDAGEPPREAGLVVRHGGAEVEPVALGEGVALPVRAEPFLLAHPPHERVRVDRRDGDAAVADERHQPRHLLGRARRDELLQLPRRLDRPAEVRLGLGSLDHLVEEERVLLGDGRLGVRVADVGVGEEHEVELDAGLRLERHRPEDRGAAVELHRQRCLRRRLDGRHPEGVAAEAEGHPVERPGGRLAAEGEVGGAGGRTGRAAREGEVEPLAEALWRVAEEEGGGEVGLVGVAGERDLRLDVGGRAVRPDDPGVEAPLPRQRLEELQPLVPVRLPHLDEEAVGAGPEAEADRVGVGHGVALARSGEDPLAVDDDPEGAVAAGQEEDVLGLFTHERGGGVTRLRPPDLFRAAARRHVGEGVVEVDEAVRGRGRAPDHGAGGPGALGPVALCRLRRRLADGVPVAWRAEPGDRLLERPRHEPDGEGPVGVERHRQRLGTRGQREEEQCQRKEPSAGVLPPLAL